MSEETRAAVRRAERDAVHRLAFDMGQWSAEDVGERLERYARAMDEQKADEFKLVREKQIHELKMVFSGLFLEYEKLRSKATMEAAQSAVSELHAQQSQTHENQAVRRKTVCGNKEGAAASHVRVRLTRARERRQRQREAFRDFDILQPSRDLRSDAELWPVLVAMRRAWCDDLMELCAMTIAIGRLDPHAESQMEHHTRIARDQMTTYQWLTEKLEKVDQS